MPADKIVPSIEHDIIIKACPQHGHECLGCGRRLRDFTKEMYKSWFPDAYKRLFKNFEPTMKKNSADKKHTYNCLCAMCEYKEKQFGKDYPIPSRVMQKLPEKNDNLCVQDEVIRFISVRKEIGKKKYGTVLQPHNGRDALLDAFEEAVDLCQYLAQALLERDGKLPY